MRRNLAASIWLVAVTALCFPALANAAAPVDYLRDVKPLLRARCYSCHGALRQKAGLRLDTAALIRRGSENGPVVVPGKGTSSLLVRAVAGAAGVRRMPPRAEGEPLTADQVAVLRAWIDQGARGPAEQPPEDPRRHWAFRVPARPPLPGGVQTARNPIDAFVTAAQQARGLRPVPAASPEVLLRRVFLDLTGLPPSRQELHAFLADPSPDAYEKVVDRLLASPQYGERWGRHWMDVWRYSDWFGRRSVPDVWNSAPQIWRWRDWIVRSLNADKGYDRMVVEMLAADEVAPGDDDAAVATGYLVRNWYALNYNQWMKDLVEHTGKAFLGLTFNCAHCHDHKYDPVSQDEYFRFRAFFEPLEVRQDRMPGEPDPGPFQKYEYTVLRRLVKTGMVSVFDEKPDAPTYKYAGGDERNRVPGEPPVRPGAPAFLGGDRLPIARVELPPEAYYPGLKPFVQREETVRRERALTEARAVLAKATASEAVKLAAARVAAAEADLASVRARVAADNARYRHVGDAVRLARAAGRAERVAGVRTAEVKLVEAEQALAVARRQPKAPAARQAEQQCSAARKEVEAATKAVTSAGDHYTPLSPVYPAHSTGRRRALAGWIASPRNPLTARVAVNHVWLRHFGRPLVESVFDFGRNGKPPSHPELLDWLAVELMEHGWSMKHLHRLIVTSDAYRRQSRPAARDNPNRSRDPDDRYLWHFPRRRLEAEAVRDSILCAAGELDRTVGGPVLENDQENHSRRRSLYFSVYPEGGGSLELLSLFDAPDPCDCYRRTESIVPQQALAMTNSALLLDQSRRLARKLSAELSWGGRPGTDAAFITAAFEQVLCRRPTAQERALCADFLRRQADAVRGAKPIAVGAITAPAADARQRARESLVRALFSHDNFVTFR